MTNSRTGNRPFSSTESSELNGLLWREVTDDETIDTRSLAVTDEPLLAVLHHRIVVSHEEDGDLETLGPGIAYESERLPYCDSMLKRNLNMC